MYPRLSQSAHHVLYIPANFYIQYNFYPSRRLVKKNYLSSRPSQSARHILWLPIAFLKFPRCDFSSSRRLVNKNYLIPHWSQSACIFYKYPSCFFSNTICILLVDELKKWYFNPSLSHCIRHVLYLPANFYFRYDLYPSQRLVLKKYI